jgi:hypothetical protein
MTKKLILCLDFDGVIHSYVTGWKGANIVSDPPVEGAIEFLYKVIEYFEVHIYSTRSNQPGGLEAMKTWLYNHESLWRKKQTVQPRTSLSLCLKWPTEKPSAFLTIDDRAITFNGIFPSVKEIFAFKPWYKK